LDSNNGSFTTETLKLAQQTSKAVPIVKKEKEKKFSTPLDKRDFVYYFCNRR